MSAEKLFLLDTTDLKNANFLGNNDFAASDAPRNEKNESKLYKERTKPLVSTELHRIDRVMVNILNNDTLTEDEKVVECNKALIKYQDLKSDQPINSVTPSNTHKTYNPLLGIPLRYKSKANQLWSTLDTTDEVKVLENGEVIIKDERIPGSNITDLLNLAVNPTAKNIQLKGWERFRRVLFEQNIPKLLLTKNVTLSLPQFGINERVDRQRTLLDHWVAHDEEEEEAQRAGKWKSKPRKTKKKNPYGSVVKKIVF